MLNYTRRTFLAGMFAFGGSELLFASHPACAQVGSGTPGQRIGRFRGAKSVAMSSDGSLFALQTDKTVTIHDSRTAAEHFHVDNALLAGDNVFSPDGKQLLVVQEREGNKNAVARLVETINGDTLCTLKIKSRGIVDAYMRAAFSPDGKQIALSSGMLYHRYLDLYDAQTGEPGRELLHNVDGLALQVVFEPNGKTLFVAHGNTNYLIALTHSDLASVHDQSAPNREARIDNMARPSAPLLRVPPVLKTWQGTIQRFWYGPEGGESLGYQVQEGSLTPVYLRPRAVGVTTPHVPLVTEEALRKAVMVNVSRTGPIAILDGEDVVMRDFTGKEVNRLHGKGYDRATCISFSADGKTCVVGRTSGLADVWRL